MESMNVCLQRIIKKEFRGSKINVKNYECKQYATLKQLDSFSESISTGKTKLKLMVIKR